MRLYYHIIYSNLGRTYYKRIVTEKIRTIDNKIEQNKAQYDLDKQAAKIFALSLGNVGKNEFLTGENILPEKDLLENVATIKRFEYSPLSCELKKHKKQHLKNNK